MARTLLHAALLFAILAVPAWADGDHHHGDKEPSSAEVGRVTNPLCPVTADEPVDAGIFVEHEGRRVYFCCKRCRQKFIASPEAYLANLPPPAVNADGGHDHDHALDHGGATKQSVAARSIGFAGNFHPVVVHFPIALRATYPGELAQLLTTHRWLGTSTAAMALFTLFVMERYWRRPGASRRKAYVAFLAVTAVLVGITGHFGASLIYGPEHFTW